jgi:hypothetical protein
MKNDQSKTIVEKAFWNSWGKLKSGMSPDGKQPQDELNLADSSRRGDKEYSARIIQQQDEESRKENLKLFVMIVAGILAICLIVYLLSLIDMKTEVTTARSDDNRHESASQPTEMTAEMIEASIQEGMAKGGFTTKEAYFSSELTKQSNEVDKELVEFSKRIRKVNPKMNITSLVIAKKMEQFKKDKSINGFGIEVVGPRDGESDDVKLISHLNGKTSSVEFYAEDGKVVAHFKDYPPNYCAETKGAAVCGS